MSYSLPIGYGPGARVCEHESGWQSREDLLTDVGHLRVALSRQLGRQSAVLLLLGDRYHMLVALLALWSEGHVAVLPPNFKAQSLAEVMRQSQADLVLCDGETDLSDAPVLQLSALLAAHRGEESDAAAALRDTRLNDDTLLVRVYTSGTTGAHQCLTKTAQQLLGEAQLLAETFSIGAQSVVVSTVVSHHLYGLLFGLLVPASVGARFVRETPFHPEALRRVLPHYAATDWVTVPAHAKAVIEAPQAGFPKIQRVFSSGSLMPLETAEELARLCDAEVIDVLGSTETGGIAYKRAHLSAPFVPLRGVEVNVSEDEQLVIRSPFLPAHAGTQTLGDRIRIVAGGFVHLGRHDGVVKIGGKRVSVQEIEARARGLPGIADAAALVQETQSLRGHELWLAVATPEARWTASALRRHLSEFFDQLLVPRRYRILEALPRTETGKLRRSELRQLFEMPARDGRLIATAAAVNAELCVGGSWQVPEDWVFFEGHFPGMPVLPGVVQLREVAGRARKTWLDLGVLSAAPRLKFLRAVKPGVELHLSLRRKPGDRLVIFELREGEQLVSRGALEFELVLDGAAFVP